MCTGTNVKTYKLIIFLTTLSIISKAYAMDSDESPEKTFSPGSQEWADASLYKAHLEQVEALLDMLRKQKTDLENQRHELRKKRSSTNKKFRANGS